MVLRSKVTEETLRRSWKPLLLRRKVAPGAAGALLHGGAKRGRPYVRTTYVFFFVLRGGVIWGSTSLGLHLGLQLLCS